MKGPPQEAESGGGRMEKGKEDGGRKERKEWVRSIVVVQLSSKQPVEVRFLPNPR